MLWCSYLCWKISARELERVLVLKGAKWGDLLLSVISSGGCPLYMWNSAARLVISIALLLWLSWESKESISRGRISAEREREQFPDITTSVTVGSIS